MAILTRRSDLPFDRDDSSRYLPWLVAFMVLLAALTLAGVFALNQVASNWDRGLAETLTVQLPAGEDARTDQRRAELALKTLNEIEGVEESSLVPREQVRQLLQPWLGSAADADELPLPQIIDVQIDRDEIASLTQITDQLRLAVPGATVDDHGVWMTGFLRALRSAEVIAILVFLLVGSATVGTIVFTTRTGLGLHREVIEVLHLIGARDTYIASQFAMRSMILGLRGGAIGLVVAAAILVALSFLVNVFDAGVIPDVSLSFSAWVSILSLLPATAVIAWVTARTTVLRSLSKLV